jgi:cyclopropane fatty-acyl-phospholipid synthase-like methyltransferase
MSRSVKAGLGDRAPIWHGDMESLEPPEGRYDAIFSMEAIYTIAQKERLFESLAKALKPNGQLLLTDFLLTDVEKADSAVKVWWKREPDMVHLWTVEMMFKHLTQLGLDVRIREDMTDRYRRVVIGEWARLLGAVKQHGVPRHLYNYLAAEMELAQLRMAALESGSLAIYRFHAFKKPARLMGD